MWAGKSTHLIERIRALRFEGKRVLALKHVVDDRYHKNYIMTHVHGYTNRFIDSSVFLFQGASHSFISYLHLSNNIKCCTIIVVVWTNRRKTMFETD